MFEALFIIIQILYRRWYGGWCVLGTDKSWYNSRTFQTICNVLLMLAFGVYVLQLQWLESVIITAVIQFLYYAKGHGAMFDLGHSGKPDAELIERYKKQWGYEVLLEFFPEKLWHTYWFDFSLLLIRYTLPLMLLLWYNWYVPLFGLIAVAGYTAGWYLQDRGCKFLNNSFCSTATNFGEILVGLSVGLIFIV